MDELLARIGRRGTRVVRVAIRPAERVARVIESVPVSGILLALGLLLLYVEFKTPGFGAPGIAGLLLLAVWFWGHHVAGLAGMGELVLFIFGLTLLLVEIFLIPGFGIAGVSGISLMVTALLMAMVQHYPGTPWYELPSLDVQKSVVNLGLSLLITFVVGAVLTRFLPETTAFRRLMLTSAVAGDSGYRASPDTVELVGLRGKAETPLHPSGIGVFGDRRLSVVAHGTFIEKGTPIVVAEAHGNRIVVTAAEEPGTRT
jgi:membrane-bound serine protease (ClpP class)